MAVDTVATKPLLASSPVSFSSTDVSKIAKLMGKVAEAKRGKLEKLDTKPSCSYRVERAVYYISDGSTAGFAAFQGVAVIAKVALGVLAGGIAGIVGGALSIGQAFCILKAAHDAWKGDRKRESVVALIQGLSLIAIGAIMILVSIAAITALLSGIAGVITVIGNPYVLPLFLFVLVAPTLAEVFRIRRSAKEILEHLTLHLDNKQEILSYLNSKKLVELDAKKPLKTWVISLGEKLTQEMGVKAAIEVLELLHRALGDGKDLTAQVEKCQKRVTKWRRHMRLRQVQLGLYLAIAPIGGVAASTAVKVTEMVSKFLYTVASAWATVSIYAFSDSCNVSRTRHLRVEPKDLLQVAPSA